jgi:hypothetical protein
MCAIDFNRFVVSIHINVGTRHDCTKQDSKIVLGFILQVHPNVFYGLGDKRFGGIKLEQSSNVKLQQRIDDLDQDAENTLMRYFSPFAQVL